MYFFFLFQPKPLTLTFVLMTFVMSCRAERVNKFLSLDTLAPTVIGKPQNLAILTLSCPLDVPVRPTSRSRLWSFV